MADLEHLYGRIADLLRDVRRPYSTEHADLVGFLISDAHDYLVEAGRRLGPWEEDELSYAEAARRANMLRLAIVSVAKALEVSTLSPQEYEEGYNYGRRRVS